MNTDIIKDFYNSDEVSLNKHILSNIQSKGKSFSYFYRMHDLVTLTKMDC
jgi:hypothetical protein